MQTAVPKGEGGMLAVLGSEIEIINEIINKKDNLKCYVANDNSVGQVVISGNISDYVPDQVDKALKNKFGNV